MKPTYANCISRSETARWDLEYFSNIQLDFRKPFLPEPLAWVQSIDELSAEQRLWLNQIRGYAYAYLFRFVEEYIVGLINILPDDPSNPDRTRALDLFLEEEKKHQALFRLFESRFEEGFGSPCEVIGGMKEVAETLLGHSTFSVLLLTTMLEWLTQSHYLTFFRDTQSESVDYAFRELFRLHWVEEAQHARLDSLETLRVSETLSAVERDQGINDFLTLCGLLEGLLHQQATLDVANLEAMMGTSFSIDARTRITEQQKSSYTHVFIVLGLQNRHFRALVASLSETGAATLDRHLESLSHAR